jgi:hypothetical protein
MPYGRGMARATAMARASKTAMPLEIRKDLRGFSR